MKLQQLPAFSTIDLSKSKLCLTTRPELSGRIEVRPLAGVSRLLPKLANKSPLDSPSKQLWLGLVPTLRACSNQMSSVYQPNPDGKKIKLEKGIRVLKKTQGANVVLQSRIAQNRRSASKFSRVNFDFFDIPPKVDNNVDILRIMELCYKVD